MPDEWTIRPPLANWALEIFPGSISHLDAQRKVADRLPSDVYYLQTPYLDERMKGQRGQFIAGRLPADPAVAAWSSINFVLGSRADEQARIQRLLSPTR